MNNKRQQQPQASKTNAQEVKRQNQASEQNAGFATEFASETNAQEVKQQNQQAEAKKQQQAQQNRQQNQ
ncbi:gamma-type small acid-soluble spore protein [Halalkalibacterium halodurans]|jgi:small acid-soluble spore protein E (minor gamma-type SASP)|uniref:Small, acid-soluble spore protein gamma-type n=2 Tax=Halalkalibacterium halodurans TaxID=86665 RepID=Q9KEB4_HALH5|nr:gamma-type small acid-soluble spore protein [Halalkalibacterium halodurans]MDY7221437.1 gamma-type small acid-soluble spore protein [Halalkalibacterium halodurans]MDY7240676.1 gamma-type small acid-soluble spore protein [Halalkalibacterium halodurans]MED3648376.1 gamma-type small acid-soluble spore protein [Halalkalibacterium halodurans]MED4082964.1 gamma-type small acid-soluble spore protein [Halalkalibacterium halodurans]MED4086795.1 gamma-type small acid-soluble spore protein [Halalkalib